MVHSADLHDAVCHQLVLQALKRPIWTLWIGIYRNLGVAFFSWVYVYLFDFGVIGVWFGIATSVLTGLLSLLITGHVARQLLGGLRPRRTRAYCPV